jgi:hypothetical protein
MMMATEMYDWSKVPADQLDYEYGWRNWPPIAYFFGMGVLVARADGPSFIMTDDLNTQYNVVGEAGIGWYYRLGGNLWYGPYPTYETAKHVAETEPAEYMKSSIHGAFLKWWERTRLNSSLKLFARQ